ncbi:MAG: hypothetical protein JOZ07_15195 [Solirubrobacterales bacterium]|nr:hypothetical protein [Solirubrobacterales bacterium]
MTMVILLVGWVVLVPLLTLFVCVMISREARREREAAVPADVDGAIASGPPAPVPLAGLGVRPDPLAEPARDVAVV